jgi:phosphopantetheine adenylyltransferase
MHQGHKDYLALSFELAQHVVVTVTSSDFAQHWKRYQVSTAELRAKRIVEFIEGDLCVDPERYQMLLASRQEQIVETLSRPQLDLVICIPDYLEEIEDVNVQRLELGLRPYHILIKPQTRVAGHILSSTDILQGRLPF